jgi:hypothetical protein
MAAGRAPQPVQREARASGRDVLRRLALRLFRCAVAAVLFLATGSAAVAQEGPLPTGEQEEISVKAGEAFKFKVHLDKAPASSDGRIMFATSLLSNSASGVTRPNIQFCALTEPEKLDYDCEVRTTKGAVVGTLPAEIVSVWIEYPGRIPTSINWKPVEFLIQGIRAPLVAEGIEVTLVPAAGSAALAQEGPPSTSEQEEVSVKAGETLKLNVHLDKAPTSSDGRIMFVTSPLSNTSSGFFGVPQSCASTDPQKLDYDCGVRTTKGAVVGTLHAEIESVWIQYPDRGSIPKHWKPISFLIQGPPRPPVAYEGIEVTLVPATGSAALARERPPSTSEREEITIKAGESLPFKVHLDKAPSSSDGEIVFETSRLQNISGSTIAGNDWRFCALTIPHKLYYDCEVRTNKGDVVGTLRAEITAVEIKYPVKYPVRTVRATNWKPISFLIQGPPRPPRPPVVYEGIEVTLVPATGSAALARERPPSTSEREEIAIKAGESLPFKVHLDKAPSSSDGEIVFETSRLQNISGSTIAGNDWRFCALAVPHKLDYDCEVRTNKSDVVGTLRASITHVGIQYPTKYPYPIVISNFKPIEFLVQGPPRPPVVYENIEVTLVPSQAQLLRLERIKLQRRISNLKAAVARLEQSKAGVDSLASLLRKSVRGEILVLEGTQRDFDKFATGKQKPAATVFFDDLHSSYERALVQIDDFSQRAGVTGLALRLVSQGAQDARPGYLVLAQATFRPFEQNELAYRTVVDTDSLTFDLEVRSSPEGATVSYRRRGDTFQQEAEPTDTVIRALPYAIWFVKFHKTGFRDKTVEHDPFRDPNHVVEVSLQR